MSLPGGALQASLPGPAGVESRPKNKKQGGPDRDTLGFGGNPTQCRAASMADQDQLLVAIAVENSTGAEGIARRIAIVDDWIEAVGACVPEE